MLNQEQIQEILEKNQGIIKSFGVSKLDLLNQTKTRSLSFQVEFGEMSLDIYTDFKNYLEKLIGNSIELTLKGRPVTR